MENKLQQLTEKLYHEGLESGRKQSEAIVATANAEASKILAQAQAKADEIVAAAKKQAEDMQTNTMTEISLAGRQALAKIKGELENAVVSGVISSSVKSIAMEPAFLKDMMLAVASSWSGSQSGKISFEALLPEAKRAEFDSAFSAHTAEMLAQGVEVGYSTKVTSGFRIAAKDAGYYLSFTEADFDALMRQYLREKVSNMLFKG